MCVCHAGVVGGRPIGGDVFNSDLTGLSQQQIIDLTVLQCPIGYWGGGDTLAAQCTKCPDGATTKEPGSLTIDDCNGESRAHCNTRLAPHTVMILVP